VPNTRPTEQTGKEEYHMSAISELVFLDRYAVKDPNKELNVGDIVVALVKDDPKFPQREVGIVRAIDGDLITVELKSTGELIKQDRKRIDKPLETHPSQMWDRMAKAIVQVEEESKRAELEKEFRWALDNFRFSPGGRINAMLGTGQELTAYNCYVIPMEGNDPKTPRDSRQAIIDTLGNMVEIMSRGGGVGINLSTLRPRLAYVKGVNGRSSGAVSWGGLFSFATGLVEQGGSRRGALMLILNDWHPDILDFIKAKRDMGAITNANISVGISDAFMEAVEHDKEWQLVFPDTSDPDYDRLWDGNLKRWRDEYKKPVIVYKTVRAREMWDTIMESAWLSAEPGVVFLERMNEYSNSWYFEDLISTNPCGEQPLPGWGVCNLGHINLSRFVKDGEVLWEDLRRAVRLGVRFLDNVIDVTPYFFERNEKVQKAERRIGLGTLGLGEMLIMLGLRYGSDESIAFIDKLYEFICTEAYLASTDLAKEKGPFPKFDAEKFLQSKFVRSLPEQVREKIKRDGIRNVCILTQAPTGSTGTMIGTSTGIEPYYSWTYWRKGRLGMKEVQEPIVQRWFEEHPEVEPKLENLPDYFVTAMDLTPKEHIRVQAAVQRWTDASISKTANCPNHYTIEQTKELYEYAYRLGCKGVTVYRDGSRDEQVLSRKDDDKKDGKAKEASAAESRAVSNGTSSGAHNGVASGNGAYAQAPAPQEGLSLAPAGRAGEAAQPAAQPSAPPSSGGFTADFKWIHRPQKLTGATYEWPTPLGKAFITVNELEGRPVEVFVNIGKAGSDVAAASEALGRLTTLFLKHAAIPDVEKKVSLLVDHLANIGGSSSVGFGENRVTSVPDAIAKTLRKHLAENGSGLKVKVRVRGMDLCPTCGTAALAREEGCYVCKACGYSKC